MAPTASSKSPTQTIEPEPGATLLEEQDDSLAMHVAKLADEAEEPELALRAREGLESLRNVARAAEGYPSPLGRQALGEGHRDAHSLLERLTSETLFSMALVVPTRGAIVQALSLARLNNFRMLRKVLEQLGLDDGERRALWAEADDNVAACVRWIAVEELLRSIACEQEPIERMTVRRRAALLLLHLWHSGSGNRLSGALKVLEATWEARRHCRIVFGTMLGASELYSLLDKGADVRFMEFLTRNDCTREELEAFHEFLFGLSIEEIRTLGDREGSELVSLHRLQEEGTGSGKSRLRGLFQSGDLAEQFFRFFMKRQVLAANRAQMDLPGPRKTAEQYVLEHLLETEWDAVESSLSL